MIKPMEYAIELKKLHMTRLLSFLIGVVLLLTECEKGPIVNESRFRDEYFVLCILNEDVIGDTVFSRAYIQRFQYLFSFKGDSADFPVAGATVNVVVDSDTISFSDDGYGNYSYKAPRSSNPFTDGKRCVLTVALPGGKFAYGETFIPEITLEERDTLRIFPDSITVWTYLGGGIRIPSQIDKSGRWDSLQCEVKGAGELMISGMGNWLVSDSGDTIYFLPEIKDGFVYFIFASPRPSHFLGYTDVLVYNISLGVHQKFQDYVEMLYTDDYWPIEEIEKMSNVEGAYGFFYGNDFGYKKEYKIRLTR